MITEGDYVCGALSYLLRGVNMRRRVCDRICLAYTGVSPAVPVPSPLDFAIAKVSVVRSVLLIPVAPSHVAK